MANKDTPLSLPEDALTSWATNVAANPNYQNADQTAKDAVADDFFIKRVAPNLPQDQLDAAHQHFIMATTEPKDYYTSPAFLSLSESQRKDILRDNMVARGMTPDEINAEGKSVKYLNYGDIAGDFSQPVPSTAVDDEYEKFYNDPAVAALRHEAWGKSVGAPFVGASQTRAAITGEKELASDANDYVARKNQLQEWFPEAQAGEIGADAALLAPAGAEIAAATKAPAGAGLATRAVQAATNTASNAALATTINPEQTESGTPEELRSKKEATLAENIAFNSLTHGVVPAVRGLKNIFGGALDSATGLYNNIVNSASKVAKATGKSKEEVLQSVADDLANANPKEQTAAGITGVKSPTAPNSATVVQGVNTPTSGTQVNADVRTNQINKQAEAAIETAGTRVAAQKGDAAPILKAKDLKDTSLEDAKAQLAPKKLAQPAFATSDPMARATPVGQASEVSAAIDQAILPNSKLLVNESPVAKAALDNSPTVQAIRAAGENSTPPLTAEYQATVKQLGQETADNLVKNGQIQQFAKGADAGKPMTAETLQDHIDGLESEIQDASNTKQKAALMGAKNKLIDIQNTVYQANPGLKEAVTKSVNAAKTDRALTWFEDSLGTLDKDNSMDFTGKLKQNLKITNAQQFLAENGTTAAAKDRAKLMAHDPELLKASNDLVEAVGQWQRQNDTAIKGAAEQSGVGSATKAIVHGGISAKTTALTNAIAAVNKTLNKRYAEALEDFANNNPKAHDALNAAIKKNGKQAAMRDLYQTVMRPAINAGSSMGANAISDRDQKAQSEQGQINISPYTLPSK